MDINDKLDNRINEELKVNLNKTLDHTLKTISNLFLFFNDPQRFNSIYDVNISSIKKNGADLKTLHLLMYIHDFFKLVDASSHAERGANFISIKKNLELIRFHDIFGIIHTGEASILFLEDLIKSIRELSKNEIENFLNSLIIITIIDVASYGFLNQARIETYQAVIEHIKRVLKGEDIKKIAVEDTPDRIRRLICSNNRFTVEQGVIEEALNTLHNRNDLLNRLMYLRFDAGVYVLEPVFRYLVDNSKYKMSNKEKIDITNIHKTQVIQFIKTIVNLISEESIKNSKKIIDLNYLSIKNDDNLICFENWANEMAKTSANTG